MRLLVTGAGGFLGSHLCDRLLAAGHEVIGMDNFVTGVRRNLSHLEGHPRFELRLHDVTLDLHVAGPLDGVLHFASPASPPDYLRLPLETLRAGTLGTLNALGLARAKGARFLLASTSEVYGDPQVHPQPETYWGNVNPVGPRAVYDESKRFGEATTMTYRRVHGVDTRIARIFNTYGPRMRPDDGRIVSTFIGQALRDEPITVHGDGSHTRSFCFVDDLVDGVDALFERGDGEPVNLGNPEEISVLEVARLIIGLTDSRSRLEFRSLPLDDPHRRCPDISRAVRLLGWRPAVPLIEGLRRTIAQAAPMHGLRATSGVTRGG